MPIVRSYMCSECGHYLTVTLAAEQCDDPPPICPRCNVWDFKEPMQQDFKPAAIVGHTPRSKAEKIKEDILDKDYNVASYNKAKNVDDRSTFRYKDQPLPSQRSSWGVARETLEGALSEGRANRIKYGSGLDILHQNLKSGAEPDLIEISKRRAMKVW